MGVGGRFWDLLKPYARSEDFDFLRDKKVAVDLSFWTVQNETAIKGHARNPHLRLIFFRTINLFSKFGAYPVFVVDGVPSPLKAQARAERFFRATGVDSSGLPKVGDGVSPERNVVFRKHIQDCVELLQLMGLPVLRAKAEAEALCAQLNREGHVDACITGDSDAFLYGAKCVIKCIRPNSREPFECYHISDIELGLGLQRKQLVAVSLLVGNDHDLQGVPGIGTDTALRFVQLFSEDEILDGLQEVGKRGIFPLPSSSNAVGCSMSQTAEDSAFAKVPHCSHCGHPGSKKDHLEVKCEHCKTLGVEKCKQKPVGFKCECLSCCQERRTKEQKRQDTWRLKVCQKIASEENFPNTRIISMYLCQNNGMTNEEIGESTLSWHEPQTDALVAFLIYHQNWSPSYIRQRMLPLISTIFLRRKTSDQGGNFLLCDQYEFHSIQRVKTRYGHQFYTVKWKRAIRSAAKVLASTLSEEIETQQIDPWVENEFIDVLDEPDVPKLLVDKSGLFLLTDENKELVRAAYPEKVDAFLQEKGLKESKSQKKSGICTGDSSTGIQRSITEFYRCTKAPMQAKQGEDQTKASKTSKTNKSLGKGKKTPSRPPENLSKSARRRLLFD